MSDQFRTNPRRALKPGRFSRGTVIAMAIVILAYGVVRNTLAGGEVLRNSFHSTALGVTKSYRVYLPRRYAGSDRRYPVIYLLHGWGVTEDAWAAPSLDLPSAADAMDLQAIVVMPDGDRSMYANSVTQPDYEACLNEMQPRRNRHEKREEFCVHHARYEDYIVDDLVRQVDNRYRTIDRREGRAVSGESAGGAGAFQLAMRHRNLFSSASSHSGGLARLYDGPRPYDKERARVRLDFASYPSSMQEVVEIFGTDIKQWTSHDPYYLADALKDGELGLYFDCGRDDETGAHDQALFLHDRLKELGVAHQFESIPGKHDEALWKVRIRHSLRFHVDQFVKAGVYPQR